MGRASVGLAVWSVVLLIVASMRWAGDPADAQPGDGESASHSLALELDAPTAARLGERVPLRLSLKNLGDHPVQVALGGRPAYDFVIAQPDGTEVWRWSHGQFVQQILQLITVRPGEAVDFTEAWPQLDNAGRAVPAGAYVVRGLLNVEPPGRLETQPWTLHVGP
jgi:hypothetical protein